MSSNQHKTKPQPKTHAKTKVKHKPSENKRKARTKSKTKTQVTAKQGLHPRNLHQGRYDIPLLCVTLAELSEFVIKNPNGEDTIDFANPLAVKTLNKALLMQYYRLTYWDIPTGFLCPPIPSRADYVHHIADLLTTYPANNPHLPSNHLNKTKLHKTQAPNSTKNAKNNVKNNVNDLNVNTNNSAKNTPEQPIRVLDIGTGANLIYPIIGTSVYGWQFTASDIDTVAIENARFICQKNPHLTHKVIVKQQTHPEKIFTGIIKKTASLKNKQPSDWFDVTMCNPPFHASLQDAMRGNLRKQNNLTLHQQKRNPKKLNTTQQTKAAAKLNFGGQKAELWCDGGEIAFIKRMINESQEFATQVGWFTTLVSKSTNVAPILSLLAKRRAQQVETIHMQHGQKTSRIIAWRW